VGGLISNINIGSRYKIAITTILVVIGMVCFSYLNARKTAEALVGPSMKYFQFSNTKLRINPIHKKSIVWVFEFSNPGIMDAEFEVYVSVLGKLVITNPKDLEDRIRNYEKLDVHPYSRK